MTKQSSVSVRRAALAGLAGAVANSLAIRAFHWAWVPTGTAGLSKLVLAINNAALGATGLSFRLPEKFGQPGQEIFHTAMGIVMAIVFAWLFFPRLPGPPVIRGLMFSLLPWLMQSLIVDPYMGFGFFGAGLSPVTPFVSLGLNLLYGLVIGFTYRPKEPSVT